MHWLNKHARFRNRLSPYVDGALSSSEIATLEAHLGTCEACRAELDELRATVAATRELPQVDAPRSFALTPQMLEGRGPAAAGTSAPPLALGMRLASAGVAVFLAVAVIGDLSGVGGGSDGSREAADQSTAESRSMAEFGEADAGQAEAGAAVPAPNTSGSTQTSDAQPPAEDAAAATGSDSAECPPAAPEQASGGTSAGGAGGPASTSGAGGGAVGGVGGPAASPEATPLVESPATPTPALRAETETGCEEQRAAAAVAPTPSAPGPEAARDATAETASADGALEAQDDGGVSTLRVIEIVLAGSLIALVAAIAVELVLRRRRAA